MSGVVWSLDVFQSGATCSRIEPHFDEVLAFFFLSEVDSTCLRSEFNQLKEAGDNTKEGLRNILIWLYRISILCLELFHISALTFFDVVPFQAAMPDWIPDPEGLFLLVLGDDLSDGEKVNPMFHYHEGSGGTMELENNRRTTLNYLMKLWARKRKCRNFKFWASLPEHRAHVPFHETCSLQSFAVVLNDFSKEHLVRSHNLATIELLLAKEVWEERLTQLRKMIILLGCLSFFCFQFATSRQVFW